MTMRHLHHRLFAAARFCQALAMHRCLLFVLLPLAASTHAEPQHWRLDPVHTQIRFSVDHQGFSHSMGLLSIRKGTLDFDPDDLSHSVTLDVTIDLASLFLGDKKWRETVLSWQFLNAKKWPVARYIADHVEMSDAHNGLLHGQLTLHGKTLPVVLDFKLNRIGNDPYRFSRAAGFAATATITRSAFGMNKLLSVVGDPVWLEIAAEAIPDSRRDDTTSEPNPPETDDNDATQ